MRVVERMICRRMAGGRRIRVWKNEPAEPGAGFSSDANVMGAIDAYASLELKQFAESVARVIGVNAVEVTDASGNGVVIYPEWP